MVAGPHESTFDLLYSAGAQTQLVSPVSAVGNTTVKSRCRGPERARWLLMTRPPGADSEVERGDASSQMGVVIEASCLILI